MNLYLLTRNNEPPHHDAVDGFVIRATSQKRARSLASSRAGDEGAAVWTDPEHTSCTVLARGVDGAGGVVLVDFNAG